MNKDAVYVIAATILFPLACLGTLEIRNHLIAGPLREWYVEADYLTEAVDLMRETLAQRRQADRLPAELMASQKKMSK